MTAVCQAPAGRHGTSWRYRRWGCRCPEAIADEKGRRQREARNRSRRHYIRGHQTNGGRRTADVDQVAVDRAAGGDRTVQLTPVERGAAVALLDRAGLTATQIALRLACTTRTVQRWRAHHRQPTTTT